MPDLSQICHDAPEKQRAAILLMPLFDSATRAAEKARRSKPQVSMRARKSFKRFSQGVGQGLRGVGEANGGGRSGKWRFRSGVRGLTKSQWVSQGLTGSQDLRV